MKFIKFGCNENDNICRTCENQSWTGPLMVRIPQPIPSETNHGQYEDVFNISMYKDG